MKLAELSSTLRSIYYTSLSCWLIVYLVNIISPPWTLLIAFRWIAMTFNLNCRLFRPKLTCDWGFSPTSLLHRALSISVNDLITDTSNTKHTDPNRLFARFRLPIPLPPLRFDTPVFAIAHKKNGKSASKMLAAPKVAPKSPSSHRAQISS